MVNCPEPVAEVVAGAATLATVSSFSGKQEESPSWTVTADEYLVEDPAFQYTGAWKRHAYRVIYPRFPAESDTLKLILEPAGTPTCLKGHRQHVSTAVYVGSLALSLVPVISRGVIQSCEVCHDLVCPLQTVGRCTDNTCIIHLRRAVVRGRLPCEVHIAALLEIARKLRI